MIEIITYCTSENLDVLRAVEKRFGKPWHEVRNADFEAECPACGEMKDRLMLTSIDRPDLGRQEICPACYHKISSRLKT